MSGRKNSSRTKILNILMENKGGKVTLDRLVEITGLNTRQVGQSIYMMKQDGYKVKSEKMGKSSQHWYTGKVDADEVVDPTHMQTIAQSVAALEKQNERYRKIVNDLIDVLMDSGELEEIEQ